MESEAAIVTADLNGSSYPPDEQLITRGYKQRLYLQPTPLSTPYNVFGLAHLRLCIDRPQIVTPLLAQPLPDDLKGVLNWIVQQQLDHAGLASPQYLSYYVGLYASLEATSATWQLLSDLFKVQLVIVTHTEEGRANLEPFGSEDFAPAITLEFVGGCCCALTSQASQGLPFEGTLAQLRQHFGLGPQQIPQPPVEQGKGESDLMAAKNLIATQLQIIQSLVQANKSLPAGDTMALLDQAGGLAQALSLDQSKYAQIKTELAANAESASKAPAQSSARQAANPKLSAPSIKSKSSTTPGCQLCQNTNQVMLYVDGPHRACQICFQCCSKHDQCPTCKTPYSYTEKNRFKVIALQ